MKEQTLVLCFILFAFLQIEAQINVYDIAQPEEEKPLTRTHQWEFGLHSGHFFSAGNVDFIPGYGVGLHIRRATDYVFSIRADLMYGKLRGEDPGNIRSFDNTWFSGTLQGIASLNNLKWNSGERKSNFYGFAGLGVNSFEVELTENDVIDLTVEGDIAMHADLGLGIAFKVNEKLNIGLEHKFSFVFGGRSDLPDGVQTFSTNGDDRGTFRDLLNYTSVRINLNLGKNATSAPLYWVNPLDSVMNEVNTVKQEALANKEAIENKIEDNSRGQRETDLEPSLLEGDSMEDEAYVEPLQPVEGSVEMDPGETVENYETPVEQTEVETETITEYETTNIPHEVLDKQAVMEEVEKMVEARLKDLEISTTKHNGKTALLLLPTVYFDNNSTQVKKSYASALETLADGLKADPTLQLLVVGHADQVGTPAVNDQLSYQRALNVIEHLILNHQVERSQLILHWRGENDPVSEGSHAINRRVTFEEADGAEEMAPPAKQ